MSASLVSSQDLAHMVWSAIRSGHVSVELSPEQGRGKRQTVLRPGIMAADVNVLANKVAGQINDEEAITTPSEVRGHLVKLFAEGAVIWADNGRAVATNSVAKRQRSLAIRSAKRQRRDSVKAGLRGRLVSLNV